MDHQKDNIVSFMLMIYNETRTNLNLLNRLLKTIRRVSKREEKTKLKNPVFGLVIRTRKVWLERKKITR